jgi:hypothetical protein
VEFSVVLGSYLRNETSTKNGDQWKECRAVIDARVFLENLYVSHSTVVASVKELYPRCEGQLHSLEDTTLVVLVHGNIPCDRL